MDWATWVGVDLHLELDPASGRRAGLERALREAIRAGRLAPYTRLPSTRSLALELDLARGTVSAAYDQLIAEGYLSARTGSGTVVADLAECRAHAVQPAPEVLGAAVRPSARQPRRFHLSHGSLAACHPAGAGCRPGGCLRLRRPARPGRAAHRAGGLSGARPWCPGRSRTRS